MLVREKNGTYTVKGKLTDDVILEKARAICEGRIVGDAMNSPEQGRDLIKGWLQGLEHEVFGVVFLDTKNRVLHKEIMFRGSIDQVSVPTREVIKEALRHNCASVFLVHNHPSGLAEPSQADKTLTTKLCEAFDLIGVKLLDHFVVGEEVVSFADRGLI